MYLIMGIGLRVHKSGWCCIKTFIVKGLLRINEEAFFPGNISCLVSGLFDRPDTDFVAELPEKKGKLI